MTDDTLIGDGRVHDKTNVDMQTKRGGFCASLTRLPELHRGEGSRHFGFYVT